MPWRAAQPPFTSSTTPTARPTEIGAGESGTASGWMPTIRPSRAMKSMSSGMSVFFIQNEWSVVLGKDEEHAAVLGQRRAIHETALPGAPA